MSDRKASRTAMGTAYLRAAHQLLDSPPLILVDDVTGKLIDKDIAEQIVASPERFQTTERRELRSHVVLRSRYAEDRLFDSLKRGIKQYIILGAGFDTFAYRQPDWAGALDIFEVDQIETQKEKLLRLREAGIIIPANTHHISIDFEEESLFEGLKKSHISFEKPAFFSWLGVSMYLTESAVDAVLRTIIKFPKGSEIVFTFSQPRGISLSSFINRVSKAGEPFKSYFTMEAMEKRLREIGLSKIEFLAIDEAEERYYRQRPNDLPLPKRINIASAIL